MPDVIECLKAGLVLFWAMFSFFTQTADLALAPFDIQLTPVVAAMFVLTAYSLVVSAVALLYATLVLRAFVFFWTR